MRLPKLVMLLLVSALVGCTTYTYKGEKFSSRSDAEAAIQRDIDDVINGTERRPTPVADRARVVVPSMEAIQKRGLLEGGSVANRDYVASALYKQMQLIPAAIKKRNLFKRVDVEETEMPDLLNPTPGVITIYRYLSVDRKSGSWYYSSEATPRAPLNWDTGESNIATRYRYFLDSIEALAATEKTN